MSTNYRRESSTASHQPPLRTSTSRNSRRLSGALGSRSSLLNLLELVGNLDRQRALAEHLAVKLLDRLVLLLGVLNLDKAETLGATGGRLGELAGVNDVGRLDLDVELVE